MKFLILIAFSLTICSSKPVEENFVNVQQDTAGNYEVQFKADDFTKSEKGTQDGQVAGTYSYIDADGKSQTLRYVAGIEGFVVEGTNLPVPVVATDAVARATSDHFDSYKVVLKKVPITEEFDQELSDASKLSQQSHQK